MRATINDFDALIVVDMQKDFMPGGALPVAGADKIVPAVNKYIELFSKKGNPIFFTRDWHPTDHISFKENGGIWPRHCVQHSDGAAFVESLEKPKENLFLISKGTSNDFDAYSGFQGTILHALLQERGIRRLFICGVATDYCVKNSAFGALHLRYTTFVLQDAIKEVFDAQKSLTLLMQKGAVLMEFSDLKEL